MEGGKNRKRSVLLELEQVVAAVAAGGGPVVAAVEGAVAVAEGPQLQAACPSVGMGWNSGRMSQPNQVSEM